MSGLFQHRVLAAVRRIPAGQVATYGDIAAAAGQPRAARAVGNIMKGCSVHGVPCHRVVAAGGLLGGYGGNENMKRALLRAEGITVSGRRIRGFAEIRWKSRKSRPRALRQGSGRPLRRVSGQATRQRDGDV
jgi:methylated-DNA-[protein]-cysteine S-methyltransferase